jgi:hypothetical protein
MTAVLIDEVVDPDAPANTLPAPAARLTLTPEPNLAAKRVRRTALEISGDPMVDASTRLLSIPVRHVYAALWRMGLIEVR